jgi:hypothetical protein
LTAILSVRISVRSFCIWRIDDASKTHLFYLPILMYQYCILHWLKRSQPLIHVVFAEPGRIIVQQPRLAVPALLVHIPHQDSATVVDVPRVHTLLFPGRAIVRDANLEHLP